MWVAFAIAIMYYYPHEQNLARRAIPGSACSLSIFLCPANGINVQAATTDANIDHRAVVPPDKNGVPTDSVFIIWILWMSSAAF